MKPEKRVSGKLALQGRAGADFGLLTSPAGQTFEKSSIAFERRHGVTMEL